MCRACEKSCLTRFVTETSVKLPCPECLNMEEGAGAGGPVQRTPSLPASHRLSVPGGKKNPNHGVWTANVLVMI